MKLIFFHLMPYRDLPEDFERRYHSVWVDVPNELFDPEKGRSYFHEYLDQLEFAEELGFDGIGVNEHHQNAYGLMPSPNIMAATLARRTSRSAVVVLGDSLALYNPPLRVAEEFAMLDHLCNGRLVAGLVVGTAMDSTMIYGVSPLTLRERFREAHDLIIQAWTRRGPFAFHGKYNNFRYVNIWPRPLQQPHPPVWVPGTGSVETIQWVLERNYMYASLGFVPDSSYDLLIQMFWDTAARMEVDDNPYRLGVMRVVCVSETDARAEKEWGPHVMYFAKKLQHIPLRYNVTPGYMSPRSFTNFRRLWADNVNRQNSWGELVEKGIVIGGSPATVRDRLLDSLKRWRAGHMMAVMQVGSSPDDLTRKSMELFAREVMPALKGLWSEYTDHWWPQSLERGGAANNG